MNMNPSFIAINDQVIAWEEIMGYMQLFGKLQPFLQEVIGQHVLIQEINNRDDLDIDSSDVMQAIMDFRLEQGLSDSEKFKEWLKTENLTNQVFQNRIALGLKIEKLKTVLTESKLEYYFKENQNSLSQYSLHRLMTADKELAEKLSQELQAEKTVEELAKEYGESDPPVRIFKQQVQQRSLPKTLQNSFDSATSGTVVGPVEIDKSWSVFSVIDIIPAELDEKTKKQIEAQLFSEWLVQQVQDLKIDFRSNTADVSTSN